MAFVHAHLLRTAAGMVFRREHERTEHAPKIADEALLGGVPARAVLGMIYQGAEGGKQAARHVGEALAEGRVTRDQVTDTFGNARFRFAPLRFLKPEVGEGLSARAEAGYRAFLGALGLEGDLPSLAKAHIQAHESHSKLGTVFPVREHEDRRVRHGFHNEGGVWRHADGTPVDDETARRLKALVVPPAWTGVRLGAPGDRLQVTGFDSKGRKQYRYSADHSQEAHAEKFQRLAEFHKELPVLRRRINAVLRDPKASARDRDAAIVLTLIDRTGFRIGSDSETKAAEKAFGASTLRAEHVQVDGNKLAFSFVGKKGVRIEKVLRDQELAALIGPKVKRGGRLFRVDDDYVRQFLHDRDGLFLVKDFRTWNGTAKALAAMERMPVPKTPREFAKARLAVARYVAKHLGNTPAVALKSYIDPSVWGKWEAR